MAESSRSAIEAVQELVELSGGMTMSQDESKVRKDAYEET
jgi:hypothetical protein